MSLHRISKNIRFLFLILLVFSAVNLNLEYQVKLINQYFKPYLLIHQFPVGGGWETISPVCLYHAREVTAAWCMVTLIL